MDQDQNEAKSPSWADGIKNKSKELAIALGAIALLIPVFGDILDKSKAVICSHFIECNAARNQEIQKVVSSATSIGESSQGTESYHSKMLGISFSFPVNLLSLDNTERQHGRLHLIDENQIRRTTITRAPAKLGDTILDARTAEAKELEASGYKVTYLAPEKPKNVANWYVISGIKNGTVFYIRRYYIRGELISYHVNFPKHKQSRYSPFIDLLKDKFRILEPS